MLTVLRHSLTPRIVATLVLELVAAASFFVGAPLVEGLQENSFVRETRLSPWFVGFFVLLNLGVVQFCLWSFGLYSREIVYSGTRVFASIGGALLFTAVLLGPFYLLFAFSDHPFLQVPLYKFSAFLGGFGVFLVLERSAMLKLFRGTSSLGTILILGTGDATRELVREVRRRHGASFRLAGLLTNRPFEVGTRLDGCRVLGTLNEVRDHVAYCRADTIVVAVAAHDPDLPTEFLVRCKLAGIRVVDAGEFYETLAKKVLLEHFSPVEFLYQRNLLMTQFRWCQKLLFEKSTALVILLLSLPLMALAALLVRLGSRGPVLFRQVRVGQDGRPFTLLKFRSMVQDAERTGAVWATANDPRVTPVGKVLRLTRIDELPQLVNILRGDMSIVGPRPERPEFAEALSETIPHYAHRHLVKPGLTGWAQVCFHYGASVEDAAEKLRYDLYYIKHMSLAFDLVIILNTVRIVLFQSGAR